MLCAGGDIGRRVICSLLPWEHKVLERYMSARPTGQYDLDCMINMHFYIYNIWPPHTHTHNVSKYIWPLKSNKLMRYQLAVGWTIRQKQQFYAVDYWLIDSHAFHHIFVLPSLHFVWYFAKFSGNTVWVNGIGPRCLWLDLILKIDCRMTS